MRTEINKKQGRTSERSKEARAKGAKGAKRGKNSWGVGAPTNPTKNIFQSRTKENAFCSLYTGVSSPFKSITFF